MPKRSRSGLVNSPARVVAPTRVNFASSILTERAAGPSPMMRSSWKSSIAGYSTSSTVGLRRWISSMNSTSRSSRLVSNAARSPAFAITGPEVARKPTPNSRATICASVVLPRPGGPTNSTWSSASPRLRAASMKTARLARACCWPTNSDKSCGRSAVSPPSSLRRSGVTMREGVVMLERYLEARAARPALGLPSPLRGRDERSSLLGVGGGGPLGDRRRGHPPPRPPRASFARLDPARGEGAEQRKRPDRRRTSFAYSLRQFLQPQPDQLRGLRIFAGTARGRGDRGRGLRLTVAEIDRAPRPVTDAISALVNLGHGQPQAESDRRRDRVGDRARRA